MSETNRPLHRQLLASPQGNGDLSAGEDARLPLDSILPTKGDLRWVIDALEARREAILGRWLDAVAAQPFHAGRRERAVADDIPHLFNALLDFLRSGAEPWQDPGTPLDDPNVRQAAQSHARARAEQGLQPSDVVVEFRLLRREIWYGLHQELVDSAPLTDVLSAELLVNDLLDGAISVGLAALTERIEEVREDFLVTTIHEVRQPITAVKGAAQFAQRLINREEVDLPRVANAFEQITTQANRMTTLLDTLVEASRAMLGQLELHRARTDLREVIEAAIQQLGPNAARRIRVERPIDGVSIGEWDGGRLRHVVANLLSNALKYSPPSATVDIGLRSRGDDVELSVRDRGIGIEPAEMGRLFQRYFRSRAAIDSGVDGLGLGLYLCRQIIEAHGGRIWAESDGPDTGTNFYVVLPRDGVHEGEDAASR
jgi:signal transduction histidine kinase